MPSRPVTFLAVAGALGAGLLSAGAATAEPEAAATIITRQLTASSPELAACVPHAKVTVKVNLQTDRLGYHIVTVDATGLPKNRDFTVFLLQQAAAPFGAAEYIGDVTSDYYGRAHNEFRLIVEEAFSSTLVGTTRVRKELDRIGAWFADPAGDDFCFGAGGGR